MKYRFIVIALFIMAEAFSQNTDKPFIHLQEPPKEKNSVTASRQFIVGSTCKNCSLTINGKPVKVYATGAFAYEVNLRIGDTSFNLVAFSGPGKSINKSIEYNYGLPKPPDAVKTLEIAAIESFPEGNLQVRPGDLIKIKVKSLTGCTVTANGSIPLFEMPSGMPGIYQGEYVVKETDSFRQSKIRISVTDKPGKTANGESKYSVSMFDSEASNIAVGTAGASFIWTWGRPSGRSEDRIPGFDGIAKCNWQSGE